METTFFCLSFTSNFKRACGCVFNRSHQSNEMPEPAATKPDAATSPARNKAPQSPIQLKNIAMKRILREIEHFKTEPPFYLANFHVDSKDMRKWILLIQPVSLPLQYLMTL